MSGSHLAFLIGWGCIVLSGVLAWRGGRWRLLSKSLPELYRLRLQGASVALPIERALFNAGLACWLVSLLLYFWHP